MFLTIKMYNYENFNHTSSMHQGGLQGCAVFIADFGLFLHHIGSDSNPGMTLEEPSRLRDRDVLRSCLYQSKEKKIIRADFGRFYKHLSFRKQPMKTGHSTLLYYIIPSLPHPVLPGNFRNRYQGKMLFWYSSVSMIYTSLDLHEYPAGFGIK